MAGCYKFDEGKIPLKYEMTRIQAWRTFSRVSKTEGSVVYVPNYKLIPLQVYAFWVQNDKAGASLDMIWNLDIKYSQWALLEQEASGLEFEDLHPVLSTILRDPYL